MGPAIIARNYAETLLALAQRHGGDETVDAYAQALDAVVSLLRDEPRIRRFLETPRVDPEAKKRALRAALGERAPELFVRFLLIVVEKRRQALLPEIAEQYQALVDEVRGRVRAEVTLAQDDDVIREEIVAALERRFRKTVVPTFRIDPSLLGGAVIRVEDQILDGSFRRRVAGLRRRLLEPQRAALASG